MYQPLITFCPHPAIFTQVLRLFESRIAPSRQGTIKRKGSAKQILVPDRDMWTDAIKVTEFKIEQI